MPFTSTILAVSAAVGAGTSIYNAQASSSARKKAGALQDEQTKAQNKLLKDAEDQQKAGDSVALRDQARNRQKARAAGAQGRQDTILTSPLGVTGDASGQRKTILGG